jgi:hypothetical protein
MKWALGTLLASTALIACLLAMSNSRERESEWVGDNCETTDSVDPKCKWAHLSENVVPFLCTEKPFSAVLFDVIL